MLTHHSGHVAPPFHRFSCKGSGRDFGEIKERKGINELEKNVQFCKKCGFTTVTDNLYSDCPHCKEQSIEKVKACSPLGFCVDYNADIKDFNGRFDFMPFSSVVYLDSESRLDYPFSVNNLQIHTNTLPKNGIVHQINNNNGNLFKIGKLNGTEQYVARSAFDIQKQNNVRLSNEKEYALIASKTTGVLTASIKTNDDNLDLCQLISNKKNYQAIRRSIYFIGLIIAKSNL